MDFKHELIDDIPLIIEFCKRLGLQAVLDQNIKTHGNQEGISNSQITIAWIAHILTQNNHCKSPVQEWSKVHKMTLQALLESEISDMDLEDCRLGRLLEKFADDSTWNNLEKSFYSNSFSILQLDVNPPKSFQDDPSTSSEILKTIKIDATTAYGHHEVTENSIMQFGWSKDHRSDLPQIKMMVSVEGNTGVQIASDILPGNKSDDVHYIPILDRTREIVDTVGCLMCGDSKMSNLPIRANIVQNKEFYLAPLQLTKSHKELLNNLIEQAVNGNQVSELIIETDNNNKKIIIGAGFEIERGRLYENEDSLIEWNERVLLVRSFDHADGKIQRFEEKINKVKKELFKLTSRTITNKENSEKELLEKIEFYLNEMELKPFFNIETEIIEKETEYKRGEKRNGEVRKGTYKLKKYQAKVLNVTVNQKKLDEVYHKLGWRLYVTNAKKSCLSFSSAYKFFRKTMYVIEIGFHALKDYINISPLYVRDPKQMLGMTRLLMLALKILTLMTAEVRSNMKKENIILQGLYSGQKSRKHPSPTAQSLLEYFSRQNIALIGYKKDEEWVWKVSPLSKTCLLILKLLKIPENTYDKLGNLLNLKG